MRLRFPLLCAIACLPSAMALDLVDDPIYARRIAALAAKAPRTPEEDLALAHRYMEARRYAEAEAIYRQYLAAADRFPLIYANLSVFCGKQGRYEEALRFADQAIAVDDPRNVHPPLVKASWLWELGRHDEAKALFASVAPPAAGSEQEALYAGCAACFLASVGDVAPLREAIARCLEVADDGLITFIRRDVVFDRYRQEPWFIDLVGVTVRPD